MIPDKIQLHKRSKTLELHFAGQAYTLEAEYLRVYSPSAEVKGHGPGQETLQVGKSQVAIQAVEAVGNYALKLIFDDGHDSGIYTWDYLHQLGLNQQERWDDYLKKLHEAGQSRHPETQVVQLMDPGAPPGS